MNWEIIKAILLFFSIMGSSITAVMIMIGITNHFSKKKTNSSEKCCVSSELEENGLEKRPLQ